MSFSELILTGLVAIVFLKADEIVHILHNGGKICGKLRQVLEGFMEGINIKNIKTRKNEDEQEIMRYIIDQNGNLQTAYNLDLIKPHLKPNNNKTIENGSKAKKTAKNSKTPGKTKV